MSQIEERQPGTEALKRNFLARYLKRRLSLVEAEALLEKDFPAVVTFYRQCHCEAEPETKFIDRIDREFLAHPTYGLDLYSLPTTAHLLLASFEAPHVFTTNYDSLIEKAYESLGTTEIQILHPSPSRGDGSRPKVHKLFGTAGRGDILVLEEQFERFAADACGAAPFVAIAALKGPIVYLGYSLRDRSINQILAMVQKHHLTRRSFCIALEFTPEALRFANENNIVPIQVDLLEFLYRLRMKVLNLLRGSFESHQTARLRLEVDYLREFPKLVDPQHGLELAIQHVRKRNEQYLQASLSNSPKRRHYDYLFHRSLYEHFTDQEVVRNFDSTYRALNSFYCNVQYGETRDQHQRIAERLMAKDFTEAAAAMQEHLEYVFRTSALWQHALDTSLQDLGDTFHDYSIQLTDINGRSVETMFGRQRRLLVLGRAGAGKSTYLRIELLRAVARGEDFPLYFNFETSGDPSLFRAKDIGEFLLLYFRHGGLAISNEEEAATICHHASQGRLLLIVDGLDLLDKSARVEVIQGLDRYCHQSPPELLAVLAASRPEIFTEDEHNIRLTSLETVELPESLSEQQVRDYLERRGGASHNTTAFLARYHVINFFLLDLLHTLSKQDAPTAVNVSSLYRSFLLAELKGEELRLTELGCVAWKHLLRGIPGDELAHPFRGAADLAEYFGGLIETGRGVERLRFGKHPTIGEFLIAHYLTVLSPAKRQDEIKRCLAEPRLRPVLFFLAGLLPDTQELIDLTYIHDLVPLAIHCAGNSNSIRTSTVMRLILDTLHRYHLDGQISTPEIARALRPLGQNGESALRIFLAEDYYDILVTELDEAGLDRARSFLGTDSPGRMPHRGMLRRSAIDSLGALGTEAALETLGDALGEFTRILLRANDESSRNEWYHNRWHVVIALAKSGTSRAVEILKSRVLGLPAFEDDNVAILESMTCLLHYDEETRRAPDRCRQLLRERIRRSEPDLDDDFKWRRAHTAEAIARVASFDPVLHGELLLAYRGRLDRKVSQDPEVMVRYYASRALIDLGAHQSLHLLLEVALQEKDGYWARHGALEAVTCILDQEPGKGDKLGEEQLGMLREFLRGSAEDFDYAGKPAQNLVILGLRVLGRIGNLEDLEIFELFVDRQQAEDLLSGNICIVARNEMERCLRGQMRS